MKQGEKGFTLIELLVAITVMVLIGNAAALATFQVSRGAEQNSDLVTAVGQVQNAGYWISQDTQMAQTVTTENLIAPDFLALNWIEESNGDEYQVVYTLETMPKSELKKLFRNQSINGEASIRTLVAQYINPHPEKTKCEFINGTLTLTVTAKVGNGSRTESETRTYQIIPRARRIVAMSGIYEKDV
jgi:prepilin-type N-terminal cleavage/methylation domain-containing protein